MKKTFLFFNLLLIMSSSVTGQNPFVSCIIDFETNPCWEASYYNLTIQGSDNIWQICTPNKSIFDSACSTPKAILTDSTGPYPINNTSSFIIKFVPLSFCMCAPVLGGYYKFDSDTLKDFGRIEFSLDHGVTWLNALSDTIIPDWAWLGQKPVLTGRVNQWREFYTTLWNYFTTDTLYYRYTFVSDSIQTNQEGWMLDNLSLIEHIEGLQENASRDEITIYPNPTYGTITIESKNVTKEMDVSVYNIQGQLILEQTLNNNKGDLNISNLDKGIYMVKVLNRNNYRAKMIIKD
jgi:hypothetical protein